MFTRNKTVTVLLVW